MTRLVGALLAEQTDEWAITKRYMSAETLKTPRHQNTPVTDPRPAIDTAATELTTPATELTTGRLQAGDTGPTRTPKPANNTEMRSFTTPAIHDKNTPLS